MDALENWVEKAGPAPELQCLPLRAQETEGKPRDCDAPKSPSPQERVARSQPALAISDTCVFPVAIPFTSAKRCPPGSYAGTCSPCFIVYISTPNTHSQALHTEQTLYKAWPWLLFDVSDSFHLPCKTAVTGR